MGCGSHPYAAAAARASLACSSRRPHRGCDAGRQRSVSKRNEYGLAKPRRQVHGSYACAKKTAEVLRLLITSQRHADAAALIDDVRTVGTKLQAAKPVGAHL